MELNYTLFTLGNAQLHLLHTAKGNFFVATEVAQRLFRESTVVFQKELRAGRYAKILSQSPEVINTVIALGLSNNNLEAVTTTNGVTLLPPPTVSALLQDRRQDHLVHPLRLALLKLASQESARLMASGKYDKALPVALDAVRQGHELFKTTSGQHQSIQVFPLYLLAAQANLGLKRASQCEDFLGLAGWLAVKEPEATTTAMRSQLSRLMGQLHSLKGNHEGAMKSFAEDVYYSSIEYGPEDVRTSLGYFNLAKVFQSQGAMIESKAFMKKVVNIWLTALVKLVITDNIPPENHIVKGNLSTGDRTIGGTRTSSEFPLVMSQVYEVVDMLIDIRNTFASSPSVDDESRDIAEVELTIGLALIHVNSSNTGSNGSNISEAMDYIMRAKETFKSCDINDRGKRFGKDDMCDIDYIADMAEKLLLA